MDSPQTAAIKFDAQVSLEPRLDGIEPALPAMYGAIAAAPVDPELMAQFQQLAFEWKSATAGLSSPRAIIEHPAYPQIIAMGEPILPLIFRDLQDNGGWWYPALRTLTGANPVPADVQGQPELNAAAWLCWGQANGYA